MRVRRLALQEERGLLRVETGNREHARSADDTLCPVFGYQNPDFKAEPILHVSPCPSALDLETSSFHTHALRTDSMECRARSSFQMPQKTLPFFGTPLYGIHVNGIVEGFRSVVSLLDLHATYSQLARMARGDLT